MDSREPQQEKTYISKLIPKDLLPLLLQQLWWKGFDEAQKKFPSEGTSNVAVDRLIKGMFIEFNEVAIRKQLEEIIDPFIVMSERESYYALESRELFHELDEADSATDVIVNKILAVFSLITGVTLGRKQ